MMSRLFHGVERHGIHASIGKLNAAAFGFGTVCIECRLWMKLMKAEVTRPEYLKKRLPYRLRHRNLVSSGKLGFEFNTIVSEFGVRRTWSEAAGRSFESMLPDIVSAICTVATKTPSRHAIVEQESQRLLLELQRKRAEQAQWNEFLRVADAHDEFRRARQLLDALDNASPDPDVVVGRRTVGEWLAWLRTRLESSDPLSDGPVDVLNRISKAASDVSE